MSPYLKFLAKAFIIRNMFDNEPLMQVAHVHSSFLGGIENVLPKGKENVQKVVVGNIEKELKNLQSTKNKPLLIKALVDLGLPQTLIAEWFGLTEAAISQNKQKAADDERYETFASTPGYLYFMDKMYDPRDDDVHCPDELKKQRIHITLKS